MALAVRRTGVPDDTVTGAIGLTTGVVCCGGCTVTVTVEAPGVSPENLYVQAVKLDGADLDVPELKHADLHPGGTLAFTMGPKPSGWGRSD